MAQSLRVPSRNRQKRHTTAVREGMKSNEARGYLHAHRFDVDSSLISVVLLEVVLDTGCFLQWTVSALEPP